MSTANLTDAELTARLKLARLHKERSPLAATTGQARYLAPSEQRTVHTVQEYPEPFMQISWDYPRWGQIQVDCWHPDLNQRLRAVSLRKTNTLDYASLMSHLRVGAITAKPGQWTVKVVRAEVRAYVDPNDSRTAPKHLRCIFERAMV